VRKSAINFNGVLLKMALMEVCRIVLANGLLICGQPLPESEAIIHLDHALSKVEGQSMAFLITLPEGYVPSYIDPGCFSDGFCWDYGHQRYYWPRKARK
jgi:hypothetical protein